MVSCTGGDADVGPSTVPRIGATNYVTQPVVTLPPSTVPGQTAPAGGTAPAAQEYRIRNGDTVSGIASRFGITMDQLADYNGWDGPNHVIIRGDVIKIPPGFTIPGESPPQAATSAGGSYTVIDGDDLATIAMQSGTTVEALVQANGWADGASHTLVSGEVIKPP